MQANLAAYLEMQRSLTAYRYRVLFMPFVAVALASAITSQPAHSSAAAHLFSPAPAFPSPVWGDFDGDGRPDQVVIRHGADTSRIEVLASGASISQTLSTSSGDSTVIAVDIDGDGDLDLITASPAGSELWLNDGHGVFTLGRLESRWMLSAPAVLDSTVLADLLGLTVSSPRVEPIASSPHDHVASVRVVSPPIWLSSTVHSSSLLRAPPAATTLV